MTETVGRIDERGYLRGFERRGFTPERSLMELLANSLDVLQERGSDGWIRIVTTEAATDLMDNGRGMDRTDVEHMFAMHRENHASDHSRGVSGIGAKPALSILSKKRPVTIFTRKAGSDLLRVDVPWNEIHSEGRFTGMVRVRTATADETAAFGRETGTTIRLPNSDLLRDAIERNFDREAPPLDRAGIVFGRDLATMSYSHFETEGGTERPFPKYNYFAGEDTDFYTGVMNTIVRMYHNEAEKKDRFIWEDGTSHLECTPRARGYTKEPVAVTEGLFGWQEKGTFRIRVGLRRDDRIFNYASPVWRIDSDGELVFLDAKEKMDALTEAVVGDSHRDFNQRSKLVRNGQTIGTIPLPDIREASARGNGESYLKWSLLQCDVQFNPVSSQDNHLDRAMQIQENKNQHYGDSLPVNFTRLVKAIRERKAGEILRYMSQRVAAVIAAAAAADETDTESVATASSEEEEEHVEPVPVHPQPEPVVAPSPVQPEPVVAPAPDGEQHEDPVHDDGPPDLDTHEEEGGAVQGGVPGHELQARLEAILGQINAATMYNDEVLAQLTALSTACGL